MFKFKLPILKETGLASVSLNAREKFSRPEVRPEIPLASR